MKPKAYPDTGEFVKKHEVLSQGNSKVNKYYGVS